jgi:hypothetical protein
MEPNFLETMLVMVVGVAFLLGTPYCMRRVECCHHLRHVTRVKNRLKEAKWMLGVFACMFVSLVFLLWVVLSGILR